jgi:hypothetical protein
VTPGVKPLPSLHRFALLRSALNDAHGSSVPIAGDRFWPVRLLWRAEPRPGLAFAPDTLAEDAEGTWSQSTPSRAAWLRFLLCQTHVDSVRVLPLRLGRTTGTASTWDPLVAGSGAHHPRILSRAAANVPALTTRLRDGLRASVVRFRPPNQGLCDPHSQCDPPVWVLNSSSP